MIPAGTKGTRGRTTTQPKVATRPQRVDAVVAGLPAKTWKRMVVVERGQEPRISEYASVWGWCSTEGLPSEPERLLVCRCLGQQAEWKYHRSPALPSGLGDLVEEPRRLGCDDCGRPGQKACAHDVLLWQG